MASSLQAGVMALALNLKSVKFKIRNGNRKQNWTVCSSWFRQGIMHFQASNVATIYSAREMASVSQWCSIWDATMLIVSRCFGAIRYMVFWQDIAKMRSCINVIHDLVFTIFLIETWRQEYNTERPHSSLGYRLPAPEAIMPLRYDPF